MRARFEQINDAADTSWRCYLRRAAEFDFGWHYHPHVELTYITEGIGRRLVGDSAEQYSPGDLVLMGPELPHTFVSAPGVVRNEAVVAQFLPDFLGEDLLSRPEFHATRDLLNSARSGLAFPDPPDEVREQVLALIDLPPTQRTLTLLAILDRLASTARRQLSSSTYRPSLDESTRTRIDIACTFLHQHNHEPVSLADVAAVVHMEPSAFSRFFHRTTGRTFTVYLNELRIEAACRLLVDTDLPVAEVATRSGYQNLSYFNRRFLAAKQQRPLHYRTLYRT